MVSHGLTADLINCIHISGFSSHVIRGNIKMRAVCVMWIFANIPILHSARRWNLSGSGAVVASHSTFNQPSCSCSTDKLSQTDQ